MFLIETIKIIMIKIEVIRTLLIYCLSEIATVLYDFKVFLY